MFENDKLYDPKELAQKIRIAERTIHRWRGEGSGPSYHKIGGRVFYRGEDITAWLEKRRITHGDAA